MQYQKYLNVILGNKFLSAAKACAEFRTPFGKSWLHPWNIGTHNGGIKHTWGIVLLYFCLCVHTHIYTYAYKHTTYTHIIVYISLSTVVLNSRDWPKNVWLPKRMHLHKHRYKNQNTKTYLNAITTALTTSYLHSNEPNAATLVH